MKLEGREPDALRRSTVGEQVDFVIREAQVIAIESYLAENYQEDNSDDHCDNGTDQLSPEC